MIAKAFLIHTRAKKLKLLISRRNEHSTHASSLKMNIA
jgi:hypothetical protein